jgi:hypothetical protein
VGELAAGAWTGAELTVDVGGVSTRTGGAGGGTTGSDVTPDTTFGTFGTTFGSEEVIDVAASFNRPAEATGTPAIRTIRKTPANEVDLLMSFSSYPEYGHIYHIFR